jgi:hypothetical protein
MGVPMEEGFVLVFSAPAAPDREADYNDWYDSVHVPEVLGIDGFVSARRFRLDPDQPRPPKPGTPLAEQPYVAVYGVKAERVSDVAAALGRAVPTMTMSDALNLAPPPTTVYYRSL